MACYVEKEIVMALLQFYNTGTLLRVCLPLERNPPEGTAILSTKAKFYQHVALNGRRVTPVSRTLRNCAGSSIVRANINGRIYAGEVLAFFDHLQSGLPYATRPPLFAQMRWMKKTEDFPLREDFWQQL